MQMKLIQINRSGIVEGIVSSFDIDMRRKLSGEKREQNEKKCGVAQSFENFKNFNEFWG